MRLRTCIALSLACILAIALSQPSRAATDDRQLGGPESCLVGHRFFPGPIVDGHYRQPTPREFEARMQELRAQTQTSGASSGGRACSSISGFSTSNS
jgi:hypothetical protein